MNELSRVPLRWTLADLIDLEARLAGMRDADRTDERLLFARDVRPHLHGGPPAAARRRGLRLWLDSHRQPGVPTLGRACVQGLTLLRLVLFGCMAASGAVLVAGLCLGSSQAVHVLVFIAFSLLLPWSLFAVLTLAGLAARLSRPATRRGMALLLGLAERARRAAGVSTPNDWAERLTDTPAARRACAAELGGVLQWGGLGFQVGLVLAFAAILMVFDVRFYWEATPKSDALVRSVTETVALPWAWAWPAAVPDAQTIEASRARYVGAAKQLPSAQSASAWWRFLLMALIVWGVMPRLALIGLYRLRRDRALARLDFQAPRHRRLWRELAGVTRGAVAPAPGDVGLVLDVGGSGVDVSALRGFLLRALRVHPGTTHRVSVLDDAAEAAADAALAARPAQVLMLVLDWALSPRQVAALHARVRAAIGPTVPVTWVVLALADGFPGPPDAGHLARWTAFIDGLRDPATEIAAYDPAA